MAKKQTKKKKQPQQHSKGLGLDRRGTDLVGYALWKQADDDDAYYGYIITLF